MVVNKYAAQQADLEAAAASARAQADAAQRSLAEKEREVAQLRGQQEQSESSQTSRSSALEAELTALRASSAASSAAVAELQTELAAARAKAESLEERAKGKPSSKCSIGVEDSAGAAAESLFPGVLENGRALKFSWSLSGPVRIQWFRAFRGSDWQLIPGKAATKPQYLVSADDIGASLRAEATHTVTGASVYAEAGPVHASAAMVGSLAELLRKLDATFVVESASSTDAGDRSRRLLLNKEKIKLQDAKGKTVAKKEWGDHVKVSLDGDSDRRFAVQIEQSGPVVNYIAPNQRTRDLVVVTMRTFVHVITKHGGRLNKDLDHVIALSAYVRTLSEQAGAGRMSVVPPSPAKPRTSTSAAKPGAAGKGGAAQGTPASKQQKSDSGSAPSTPESHSAATPQQPSNGRRQSGAGDDEWGGFGLPPAAHSGSVSVSASSAPGGAPALGSGPSNGAPAKPVRKNADGDEVDEEGFIVNKNRGFDESLHMAPHHTAAARPAHWSLQRLLCSPRCASPV